MNCKNLIISLTLFLCNSAPALATTFNSAVIHIGVEDTGIYGIINIITYLQADSRFSSVASLDVDADGVPSLGQLALYDSVLVTTDSRAGTIMGGGLGTQLGNVLDDYVYNGGRVVLTSFAGNDFIGIDGDILAIAPFVTSGDKNANAGALNMATAISSHFVFHGVSNFESSFASDIALSSSGIKLADYDTGTLGILTVADDSVLFINGFPGTEGNFNNGSDFGLVFANALAPIPEPTTLTLATLGLCLITARRRR